MPLVTLNMGPVASWKAHERRKIGDVWGAGVSLVGLIPYVTLAILVEALFYGIHIMLFISCIRILIKQRRRGRFQRLILIALTVMFLCTTADIAISWHIGIHDTLELAQLTSLQLIPKLFPKFILHQVNSTIADVLLIIRCYVVWGQRKMVLYGGGLVLVVGTSLGIYSECTKSVKAKGLIVYYICIILFLNGALTLLTAGRIVWIARQIKKAMGPNFVSQYYFAVAIIVESGFLYTGANVLLIILSPTKFVLLGAVIAIRAVCIMPILIIVQVATGKSINDLRIETSTVVIQQPESGPPIVLDTIISEVATGLDREASSYYSSQIPDGGERSSSWHASRSFNTVSQHMSLAA